MKICGNHYSDSGWCSEPAKDNDEKALDCRDAIIELQEAQADLYQTAFDNLVTQYEQMLTVIDFNKSMIEEAINQAEEKGYLISTEYYEALKEQESANITKLQQERTALLESLNNAVASGTIKKESEAWYLENALLSGNRWEFFYLIAGTYPKAY